MMLEKSGEKIEDLETKEQQLGAHLTNENVCRETSREVRDVKDAGADPRKLEEALSRKIGFHPVIEFFGKSLVGIRTTRESKKIYLLIPSGVYVGGTFYRAFGREVIEGGRKQVEPYETNERIESTLQPAELSIVKEEEFNQKRKEIEKEVARQIEEQYATLASQKQIAEELLKEWGYSRKEDGTLYHHKREEDLDEVQSKDLESAIMEVWVPHRIKEWKDLKVKEAIRSFEEEYITTPEGDHYHIDKVGVIEQHILRHK